MRKCPQCGRNYSDMVTVCPACNIVLGNARQSQAGRETDEKPKQEAAGTETVRTETVHTETVVSQPQKKAKMTWAGYLGYVVAALFVYAFFHNLNLFGLEDAIDESVPALFMMVIPLLLVDQIMRAVKDGNTAKAGKMALGIVVSIALFFILFM